MAVFSTQIRCLVPVVIGSFCLIQGAALAMNRDPLAQILGMGLWLCLAVCIYYTWCAFKSLSPATVIAGTRTEPEGESPGTEAGQ
jgi:hypothetical protein